LLSGVACGEKHDSYTSAREGLLDIHADEGKGWVARGRRSQGAKLGASEMCPQFLKMYPQMCPQMPPDCGTLLRTPMHFKLRSTEEKKKKAGRLCTFAALNLVPPTGIEPVNSSFRVRST